MAKQVQFRRGTTTQHSSFTGVAGEITIDTDKNIVVVHNGSTVGGIPLAKETVGTTASAAFDKANSANVLAYNTGIGANAYSTSVGASSNLWANAVGTAGNSYATSVGASANNWANTKFANTTGTLAGDLTITGNTTINKTVKAVAFNETQVAPTISGGTLTLDCSTGNIFKVALNATISTLTFTNVPTSTTGYVMILSLTADGTARTVTWGGAVKWPSATAPTLTSTNGKVDTFVLTTWDAGTNWYAFTAGQNA